MCKAMKYSLPVVLASALTCNVAGASEYISTIGTLLLDPMFEDAYIQALQRAIEEGRDNADGNEGEADISLGALQQDPDFAQAITFRLEDLADEHDSNLLSDKTTRTNPQHISGWYTEVTATNPTRRPEGIITMLRCTLTNMVHGKASRPQEGTGWSKDVAEEAARNAARAAGETFQNQFVAHRFCPSTCLSKHVSKPPVKVDPPVLGWFKTTTGNFRATAIYHAEASVFCSDLH